MTKSQSNILVLLLTVAVGLLGYLAWQDRASASGHMTNLAAVHTSSDLRETISFNDAQMQLALGQMRGFLEAIQDLDAAEMEGDLEQMARLAAKHKPGQKRAHPDGFHDQLPDTFRSMSRSMRQSFAAMEQSLNEGDLEAYRHNRLNALATCNACHNTYQFELEDKR